MNTSIKKIISYVATILAAFSFIGISSAKIQPTNEDRESLSIHRVMQIREKLLELDNEGNENATEHAQWYNWPNWRDWRDWRNVWNNWANGWFNY